MGGWGDGTGTVFCSMGTLYAFDRSPKELVDSKKNQGKGSQR
jgi:hypothetical protein